MSIVTYPPFNKPSIAPSPVIEPVPMVPLLRPPPAIAPAPPARPYLPPPPKGYSRSVHAAPAAWPKTLKESVGTCERLSSPFGPDPSNKESKEERNARILRETEFTLTARKRATRFTADEAANSTQPAQWLGVERWRRDEPHPDGVTLVVAHANGLQRELYHPMIRRVLEHSPDDVAGVFGSGAPLANPSPVVINDVWFVDDCHHGSSQDLNAGHLASIYAWADCARDLLNFVRHVLPHVGDTGEYQLPWGDGEKRRRPPVIGVGHSISGSAMAQVCRVAPGEFQALYLVEPMVCDEGNVQTDSKTQPALGPPEFKAAIVQNALKRRSEWPSRQDAAAAQSNPMFKSWDPEVFDLWLQTSLVPTGRGDEVTLATPRWAEAAIFSDPEGPQRGWDALPHVQCPAGIVLGADPAWLGGPKVVPEIPWRAPRARNERIMSGGHLLPQEAPTACADALWRFLNTLAANEWDKVPGKL